MKYLYVDNFRGFQDTLIPIKNVNFLIGENSTGKTSILSLLNLLSSDRFWQQSEFNTDQVELGNFKNIVSLESNNRDHFRIGFLDSTPSARKEGGFYFILLTFSEENDLPVLSKLNYLDSRNEIGFLIRDKTIKYWSETSKYCDLLPEAVQGKVKDWQEATAEKKLKTLEDSRFFEKDRRFFSPYYLLRQVELIKEKSERSFTRSLLQFHPERMIFKGSFAWIAPIRSKPRRTYDRYQQAFSPEGDHSPYLIKKFLTDAKNTPLFLKFIEDFGKESNLWSSIDIKSFEPEISSPFELLVKLNDKPININYVGYGISQCLPLLVEMFSRGKGSWYAIQQPEVHLHPRAQAALGTLIYHLADLQEKSFLIETHSDYIIDRFRLNYRKNANNKIDSQVLYFERTGQGNSVIPIDIDAGGNYSKDQPASFRDFFIKEQIDLLELD